MSPSLVTVPWLVQPVAQPGRNVSWSLLFAVSQADHSVLNTDVRLCSSSQSTWQRSRPSTYGAIAGSGGDGVYGGG